MSGFDFDMDLEAELHGIRGKGKDGERPQRKAVNRATKEQVRAETHDKNTKQRQHLRKKATSGSSKNRPQDENVPKVEQEQKEVVGTPEPETEGLKVKQTQQERAGGGGSAQSEVAETVDWKTFKTIAGIFEHVGGVRPVGLNQSIKRSQVSGIPEPMFGHIQSLLKARHVGAVIHFPWGEYRITEKNKVFTAKASLVRYLMFDAMRDTEGTHVQYAKQWLALHHPLTFQDGFKPEVHLLPSSDELDIYGLLYVAYTSQLDDEQDERVVTAPSGKTEADYELLERLMLMQGNVAQVLDKLNQQEEERRVEAERTQTIQTVLLLDRMGLLKGGLPRDVGELARVLEQGRETIRTTGHLVDAHNEAEKERERRLLRQRRLAEMQQRS